MDVLARMTPANPVGTDRRWGGDLSEPPALAAAPITGRSATRGLCCSCDHEEGVTKAASAARRQSHLGVHARELRLVELRQLLEIREVVSAFPTDVDGARSRLARLQAWS